MGTADMLRSIAVLAPQGVRSFAAKAPAALPAAPIRLHGLDGRYATSLWRVASSKNEVAAVEKDLASFKAVEALMEKAKYSDSTKQFFLTIADNGRLNELGNIMGKFEEIQRAAKGEIHAEVTVAD